MTFCTDCGAPLEDGKRFCTACGKTAALPEEPAATFASPPPAAEVAPDVVAATPVATPAPAPTPVSTSAAVAVAPSSPVPVPTFVAPTAPAAAFPAPGYVAADVQPPAGSPYAVLGVGGFVGTLLLFSIPVIGWIFCIVCACGGCKNRNRRNLARATLILCLVCVVLMGILALIVWLAYDSIVDILYEYRYDWGGGYSERAAAPSTNDYGDYSDYGELFGWLNQFA